MLLKLQIHDVVIKKMTELKISNKKNVPKLQEPDALLEERCHFSNNIAE